MRFNFLSNLQNLSNLISGLTVIAVVLALLSNKSTAYDFLLESFKNTGLFIGFLISVLLCVVVWSVTIDTTNNQAGFPGRQMHITRITFRNKRTILLITKIALGISTTVLFVLLMINQYKNEEWGILEGSIADKNFSEKLRSNLEVGKSKYFFYSKDTSIEYGDLEDGGLLKKVFQRKYNNGVVYTVMYLKEWKVINIKIKWIGKSLCKTDSSFSRDFDNCDLKLNPDSKMIAELILGFISLHMCDTLDAFKRFDSVKAVINRTPDSIKKMILGPLQDWVGSIKVYTKEFAHSNNALSKKDSFARPIDPGDLAKDSIPIFPDSLGPKYIEVVDLKDPRGTLYFMAGKTPFMMEDYPMYFLIKNDSIIIITSSKKLGFYIHNNWETSDIVTPTCDCHTSIEVARFYKTQIYKDFTLYKMTKRPEVKFH